MMMMVMVVMVMVCARTAGNGWAVSVSGGCIINALRDVHRGITLLAARCRSRRCCICCQANHEEARCISNQQYRSV
jgi:hypothetical protein